jgi:hypothetical protein
MYGGDEDAATRIEILRQQAAASPNDYTSMHDSSTLSILRQQAAASSGNNITAMDDSAGSVLRQQQQQLPTHNFGGAYGSSASWLMNQSANFARPPPRMNGSGLTFNEVQEKKAPPSPKVTPPSYRNHAVPEGHFALLPSGQSFPFESNDSTSLLPTEESLVGAGSVASMYSFTDTRGTKRGVPHVYHDYSQMPVQPDLLRKKSGGVSTPFPVKLYEMLENPQVDPTIVSWLPHGRAFIVRLPKRFTSEIMPK